MGKIGATLFLVACMAAVACSAPVGGSPETTETTAASLSQCVGATVKGVDVYDNDLPIDWNQLKSEGYDFAIVKATESTYDDQNGQFPSSYSGARAAGMIVGAYHFFRGDTDGVAQANWFLSVAGPSLKSQDLPAALDIETTDGASGSQITQRMWDWIHTVEKKTGKKPLVYTYSSYFSGVGVDTTGLDKYPLWIAPANSSASCFDTGGYSLPWSSATFWQYDTSSPLGGISNTAADHDKFIGTLAQLQAFAQGTPSAGPAQINGNAALSVVEWPGDAHVEVFATESGGTAQHVWTQGGTEKWNPAQSFGGPASCGLASALWSTASGDSAQVYGPSPGGNTEEVHLAPSQKGKWTSFADFGGSGLAQLSTAIRPDGHVEVFGLASDGSIQARTYDVAKGSWSAWQSIGGKLATGAAPIVHADGRVEIFATDAAGSAWHTIESKGTWGSWQSLGGQLASRPVPVRYPDDHVEVFARGADGYTWTSEFQGKWPAFSKIEGATAVAGEVSAAMNDGGRPELFARAADDTVVHMWWNSTKKTWTPWQTLGAAQQAASDPLAWVRGDGTADAFAVDASGALRELHRDAKGVWGAWSTIASGIDACAPATHPGGSDGGSPSPTGDGGPQGGAGDAGTDAGWTNDASGGGGGCTVASDARGFAGGAAQASLLAIVGVAWAARRRRARLGRAPTACAALLAAVACSAPPASDRTTGEATATTSEAILTNDVIGRAEQWVAVKLHYCQSPYGQPDPDPSCWPDEGGTQTCNDRVSNPQWNPYRSDCSGLVSWAWGLAPPGRVTGEFAPFQNDITSVIQGTDLRPGDALNNADHVVLFKQWTVPGQTATFIEEPGCSVATPYAHEFTSDVSINGSDVYISYEGASFTSIRYDATQVGYDTAPTANGNDAMSAVNWTSDGHAELFLKSEKGAAVHVWTSGGGDGWSQETDYQGTAACGVASAMWPTSSWGPYAEVFDPKPSGDTQHLYLGSKGWTAFADFGGSGVTHLSTVVAQDGHVEVYGLAADGSIEVDAWDSSKKAWGGWQSLGGKMTTGATPIVWNDGHIELFAVDASGAAWHAWTSNGKWGSWRALGGKLASGLAPMRWRDGHVEVYGRDADGHAVASVWSSGKWGPFGVIESSSTIEGSISAVLNQNGQGELFSRATDGTVVHMWWNGKAWTSWMKIGDQVAASDPLGWVRADGTGEVFAVDTTGNLVKSHRDRTGGWNAWATIATGIDSCAPAAPSDDAGAGEGGSPGSGGDAGRGTTGGNNGGAGNGGGTGGGSSDAPSTAGCSVGDGAGGAGTGAVVALLLGVLAARRGSRRSPR